MSIKSIFNNNHGYVRLLSTGKKHMVKRDLSSRKGVICDCCKKEIFGVAPFSIYISQTSITSFADGKKTIKKLSMNSKERAVEILMAGGRGQTDCCHSCVGQMRDWREQFNAKIKLGAKRKLQQK